MSGREAVRRGATMPALLQADIDLVEGERAKLSAVNALMRQADYAAWSKKRRDAEDSATRKLVEAGAVIRYQGGDTAIRFRGLRASSTMGLPGALSNWAKAASVKLAEAVS